MGDPVRVTIIALDPVLEAGTASALQACPDVTVLLPQEPAEVAVVSVDGVGAQALDVVRSTRNAAEHPEVVLMATELSPVEAVRAIAAGARGLLRRRDASTTRLTRTVLAAAGGDCTMPPDMLAGVLEQRAVPVAAPVPAPDGAGGLSAREHAVLRLVADGRETGEIARELCWSPRTVVSVMHDITHRFRLRNRAHAVAYALRAGLL